VGKDLPYARNLLTEESMSLCHIVKLQSVGWMNISLFWLITLPTFAFLLWALTIEVGEPASDQQQQISQLRELATNPLRIESSLLGSSRTSFSPSLHEFGRF
jgi:hypothetical protein